MPDTPVETTPPHPELEFRVTRLEQDMGDVKSILGQMLPMMVRIDAALPHLATKAELQSAISGVESKIGEVKGEIADLRVELAEKPSKTYIWVVLGVLIAAYAAGLAGLAVLK
jgi:hypothetical protein